MTDQTHLQTFRAANTLSLNEDPDHLVNIWTTDDTVRALDALTKRAAETRIIAVELGVDGSEGHHYATPNTRTSYAAVVCRELGISSLARVRDDRTNRFEAAAFELGLMITHQFLLPLLPDNVSIHIFTDQVIYPRLWHGSMRIRTDSEINQIISQLQDWYWNPRILVSYTRSHHDSGVSSHHDADLLAASQWGRDTRLPALIPTTEPSSTAQKPVAPTKKKKSPGTKGPAKTPTYNFKHVLSISTPHEQKILRAMKDIPVGTEVPAEIEEFPPNTVFIRHKHPRPGVPLKVITYATSATGKKTMRRSATYLGYVKRILT